MRSRRLFPLSAAGAAVALNATARLAAASAAAGRNPHVITCSPPVDFKHLPAPTNPNYLVCKMGTSAGSMALAAAAAADLVKVIP